MHQHGEMTDKSKVKRARGVASTVLFVVVLLVSVLLAATGVHGIVRVLVAVAMGVGAAGFTYVLMTRRR